MNTYSFQPLVGISGGLIQTNEWSPPVVGHRQSYVEAVLQAGGLPVVLPPLTDPRALRGLYERLDGLLMGLRQPARQCSVQRIDNLAQDTALDEIKANPSSRAIARPAAQAAAKASSPRAACATSRTCS